MKFPSLHQLLKWPLKGEAPTLIVKLGTSALKRLARSPLPDGLGQARLRIGWKPHVIPTVQRGADDQGRTRAELAVQWPGSSAVP